MASIPSRSPELSLTASIDVSGNEIRGMKSTVLLAGVAILINGGALCRAADDVKVPAAPAPVSKSADTAPAKKSQSELASKTATFVKVPKDAAVLKTALDAHDLAAGLKQVEKTNSFQGTVAKIFEPRGGTIAILNFDQDYKTAMTAVLRGDDFDKFPDLKALVGKQVLVTGKIIDYHGTPEIVLNSPEQLKLVE